MRHYAGNTGYKYFRNKFNRHMPAPSTIKSWLKNSDLNCRPGFIEQTFISLENIVRTERLRKKEVFVSLSFDEMSMRRKVEWLHEQKTFAGFINHGKRPNQMHPVASNALFSL